MTSPGLPALDEMDREFAYTIDFAEIDVETTGTVILRIARQSAFANGNNDADLFTVAPVGTP
jgi:hypothetical protein